MAGVLASPRIIVVTPVVVMVLVIVIAVVNVSGTILCADSIRSSFISLCRRLIRVISPSPPREDGSISPDLLFFHISFCVSPFLELEVHVML